MSKQPDVIQTTQPINSYFQTSPAMNANLRPPFSTVTSCPVDCLGMEVPEDVLSLPRCQAAPRRHLGSVNRALKREAFGTRHPFISVRR